MRVRRILLLGVATVAAAACSESAEPDLDNLDRDGGAVLPDASAGTDAGAGNPLDAADDAGDEGDGAVRECSDQGFCHTELPPQETLRGVWGDGQGVVWAVSDSGHILRWDGTTWSVHATLDGGLTSIWGSGPTDIWVLGEGGMAHGTGASSSAVIFEPVTDLPGNPELPLTALWGTGPNDVWAVGGFFDDWHYPFSGKGRALHYAGPDPDGGNGWALDNADAIAYDFVWGSATSGVWMAGRVEARPDWNWSTGTTIRRREPGGASWVEVVMPPDPRSPGGPLPRELRGVGMNQDGSIWLAGVTQDWKATYWRGASTDGGRTFTWSVLPREAWERPMLGFWGASAKDTWTFGESGLLQHWNGTTWTPGIARVTGTPVMNSFYAAWGTQSDDFWIVGRRIALHKTPGKGGGQ